jgi:hypothetical protein
MNETFTASQHTPANKQHVSRHGPVKTSASPRVSSANKSRDLSGSKSPSSRVYSPQKRTIPSSKSAFLIAQTRLDIKTLTATSPRMLSVSSSSASLKSCSLSNLKMNKSSSTKNGIYKNLDFPS